MAAARNPLILTTQQDFLDMAMVRSRKLHTRHQQMC